MLMIYKKKLIREMDGFSLVELLVASVIVSIIVGVIGSFLVIHIQSFETAKSSIDIQYEGQLALNRIGKVAMESGGVSYITSDQRTGMEHNAITSTGRIDNPYALVFEYVSEGNHGDKVVFLHDFVYNRIVFKTIDTLESMPYQIDYNVSMLNSEWYVFAEYVDSWAVEPSYNQSFEESGGINIFINFKKNDSTISLSNTYKYRNKN